MKINDDYVMPDLNEHFDMFVESLKKMNPHLAELPEHMQEIVTNAIYADQHLERAKEAIEVAKGHLPK